MSTSGDGTPSGEHRLADGRVVRLRAAGYDSPVARALVAAVQREYVTRYGGPDEAAVDPAEFRPPAGLFLVAEADGEPVGCAAWRVHAPGVVEVKRVYVAAGARRLGLASLLMDAMEASAAAAGHSAVVLNTGDRQPEAIELYRRRGYTPAPGYGVYADSPGAVFLGKELAGPPAAEEEQSWAS
ncbi:MULTISPECIES: GNAT family N-acetyltransferase [unclassified Blastococcus]